MLKLISLLFLIFFSFEISKAKSILILGDSHSCGSFGSTLVNELSYSGNTVDIFCAVSSAPSNWMTATTPTGQLCKTWSSNRTPQPCQGNGKIPALNWILNYKHFDQVVVALGTNSLGSSQVDSSYKKMAEKVKSKIASCLWVGPPHLRPDQAKGFSAKRLDQMEKNLSPFYDSLNSAVGSTCTLVNSLPYTRKSTAAGDTSDGVHRNQTAGASWAKRFLLEDFKSPANTGLNKQDVAPVSSAGTAK